jgi:hypothetical protein
MTLAGAPGKERRPCNGIHDGFFLCSWTPFHINHFSFCDRGTVAFDIRSFVHKQDIQDIYGIEREREREIRLLMDGAKQAVNKINHLGKLWA